METPETQTGEARGQTAIASENPASKLLVVGDCGVIDTEAQTMVHRIGGYNGNPAQVRLIELTKALCQGLVAVHRLAHCPPELRKFLVRGVCRYLSQSTTEEEWVGGAKYLLLFPIARYLGNVEPANPFGKNFLTHRRYHRWLCLRLATRSEKNTWFFSSWLNAKRGCEPLSEDLILNSFRNHRNGMLTADCATKELLEDIFNSGTNFTQLLMAVKKRIHKKVLKRRAMNPSPNASFLSTRSSGGQRTELIARSMGILKRTLPVGDNELPDRSFGYLLSNEDVWDSLSPTTGWNRLFDLAVLCQDDSELCSIEYFPHALTGSRVRSNVVAEVRTTSEFWSIEKMLFSSLERERDVQLDHTQDGLPYALCAPVLEPLKIRMVSAGPARLYASLKSFQKDIHSVMRKIPLFRLIGRPQHSTDLLDLVSTEGTFDIRYLRDPMWLSADYKSATDHLSSSLSMRILDVLLEDHPELKRDALRALGSHRIVYPPVETTKWVQQEASDGSLEWTPVKERHLVPAVTQSNGQLMGSIVSFPVLCLANAAALDLFQRREGHRCTFKEYLSSALINGDDLVTIVDGEQKLHEFKKISASIGLDLTLGKSYIDRTYANINSAAFHYNLSALSDYLTERTILKRTQPDLPISHLSYVHVPGARSQHLPVPRAINYFNYGLYCGKHKVMERVGGESENLDILEINPEFSTEIFDPNAYNFSNLPRGAHKLMERLKARFRKSAEGLQIPEEGDRPSWAVANRIINGTPESSKASVEAELHKLVYRRGEDIFFYQRSDDKTGKWRWGRRNHRLPISAGGLGMFPDSKQRYYVTNLQRALAKSLEANLRSQGFEVDTQLPRRGLAPRGVSLRHPFSARIQRVIEMPVCSVESYQTWRYKPTPLIPYGGSVSIL